MCVCVCSVCHIQFQVIHLLSVCLSVSLHVNVFNVIFFCTVVSALQSTKLMILLQPDLVCTQVDHYKLKCPAKILDCCVQA